MQPNFRLCNLLNFTDTFIDFKFHEIFGSGTTEEKC